MPYRAPHPCRWFGCGAIVYDVPYCPPHTRALDQRRGTTAERGYGAAHRAWRRYILTREPYCRDPLRRHVGEMRLATVADHIVPVSKGGGWTAENGQGLCLSCHAAKTNTHDGGGWPRRGIR